jgi:transcriptional regulator with PAS, ATPase and Fis domain
LRKKKKYVAINCGALPDSLLESELFGYVKGAFTDAKQNKPGRFALANGGTIFLDEIGNISIAMQIKLLRVLQEKEYEPLGSNFTIQSNARVIAATNKNLMDLLKEGRFRDDLYYRLNVVRIVLPPLSQRYEDIPLLIQHFIEKFNAEKGKNIQQISAPALALLMRHNFPGNVRELENIIEYAFILCHNEQIEIEHLPQDLLESNKEKIAEAYLDTFSKIQEKPLSPIDQAEYKTITAILQKNHGNKIKAAQELGIHPTTLWRKIRKYEKKADC